jgi:hypothetical protein
VASVRLVLGTSPVLDVVVVALLALHDVMDATGRAVLAVVLCTMLQFPLVALTVALVDVAAVIACASVLVEVGAEVSFPRAVLPRLGRVVLVDLFLNGREFTVRRSITSTALVSTR